MEDYEQKKFIAEADNITLGELYHRNYYKEVQHKNKVYYEYYSLENAQDIPADYNEIPFVCNPIYRSAARLDQNNFRAYINSIRTAQFLSFLL